MTRKKEKLTDTAALRGIDVEKFKQIINKIAARVDDKKSKNTNVWVGVDFEVVKQRIDKINTQLDEVRRKFDG